jgi:hypothetical protein
MITLSGRCAFEGVPADRALVQFFRKIPQGSGKEPFDYFQNYEVEPDTSFAGELVVPTEAPPDDYGLRMSCVAADQVFGEQEGPFTVTQGPTTSSSSTTTTTEPVTPPAPPAGATRAVPTFTG